MTVALRRHPRRPVFEGEWRVRALSEPIRVVDGRGDLRVRLAPRAREHIVRDSGAWHVHRNGIEPSTGDRRVWESEYANLRVRTRSGQSPPWLGLIVLRKHGKPVQIAAYATDLVHGTWPIDL